MAYYGKQSNTQPRITGQPCDICGTVPDTRWHKHVDYGRTVSIQKHAQNRIKIDAYYANHPRVNRPELAGKHLCPECANTLIFIPINR